MSTPATPAADQAHKLFAYLPTPPRVPLREDCAYQRWFDGADGAPAVGPVTVFRSAHKPVAELCIEQRLGDLRLSVDADLSAGQLRELAARLLRAADDLDAHPADGAAA